MGSMKTKHPPAFKATVSFEAYREEKTSAEPGSQYQLHPGLTVNREAHLVEVCA